MKTSTLSLAAAALAAAAFAAPERSELKVTADRMAADNVTGALVASGNVNAVLAPFRMTSDAVSKVGGEYVFSKPTVVTTCTNAHPHWSLTGSVVYRAHDEVVADDMTLRLFGVPVAWIPHWWQPLETDYGWRFMPGYTSRWGGYFLLKYVYTLAGSMEEGNWGLAGSTRFDVRTKNGVALGQGVRWNLGDFGRGKFKAYYAWDQDADRYDKHWNSGSRWHYSNWGSTVPDERYGLMAEHKWHPTERDTVRFRVAYYSDSHFRRDFLRDGSFGLDNRFPSSERNELAWEHAESAFAVGASVAGPVNDFYGGVQRLPEVWLDAAPQRLWCLPANYESQTRFGWLDREYAKHGNSATAVPFRYDPGKWADYQAFRADTYHRITAPFKIADVLAVVPRVAARGTYWSASGAENLSGYGKTKALGDDVFRSIVEGGVTLSARGTSPYGDRWRHVVEPYLDVLAQEADYSGLRRGARALYFDSIDGSADWLDQFAGRSRNLPYSWYGMTPGIRNAFRRTDEKGVSRTVVDIDFYAALQFNDTSWTEGGRRHRLSRSQERPNYGRDGSTTAAPGVRMRWYPTTDSSLMARVEWDGENDTLAYADVAWSQKLSKSLLWTLSYSARDQRWWDFSSTPYDSEVERNDDFNWTKFSYAGLSVEQELCDAVAWGPFVRWDLRENELDEAGAWLDLRTDCLGFRFSLSYENDYRRIDGSEHKDDWRAGFGIYLRALGPGSGLMFKE
jgi:hypothetical protein